jgi:hypothetical protein
MARGWESKAVEDQIGAIEAEKESRSRRALTSAELEQRTRREGLMMERARILRDMERGHKRRYLVLLERALAHVDAELARLDMAPEGGDTSAGDDNHSDEA